jgi:hypothetical protein
MVVKIHIKCITKVKRNSYRHVSLGGLLDSFRHKSTSRVTGPSVIIDLQCANAQD